MHPKRMLAICTLAAMLTISGGFWTREASACESLQNDKAYGVHAANKSESPAGARGAGTSAAQSHSQSDLQSNLQSDSQFVLQSDSQSESQSDLQSGQQPYMQSNSQPNLQPDSQAVLQLDPQEGTFLRLLGAESEEQVRDALYQGRSLADIAAAGGTDPEAVIALQVRQLADQLKQRMLRGSISLKQYQAQKAEIAELVTRSAYAAL